MSLHPQYARPRSVAQTVALLDGLGAGAMVIAGGQELMPHVNHGRLMPTVYVDIGALPELRGIRDDGDTVSIGALTVHRDLQRDSLVQRSLPILSAAAAQVGGGWQVHNRGTVGGNLVSMHPLYDLSSPLLALGAEAEVLSAALTRRLSLAALMQETKHGLGTTSLLSRLIVKPIQPGVGWSYQKLKITDGAYGSANAAALVSMDGPRIGSLRVVIGATQERPVDASAALGGVVGRAWDDSAAREVEDICSALVTQPLDDQQGDAAWRRAMAGVVARRAIAAAVKLARPH